ncbi:amino acid adenylation domain-containing protein [Myxococcus sp. AS-1-15]|uniref:non-ribosomal peptide synthetase n=1 Tax=Myxococcus sp. AS-1-15 TaxID=2874600 RepID=UPI001CBD3790|nr:non-ribosomal peptide synthetase [Myxococcus sp. AS-1-15]MBZ4400293.1 amino acid adenylation domain-containing protein [Myxococcus sp. AS-1-15]
MAAPEPKRVVGRGRGLPPLVPVSRDTAPPLSFAQQRLWFLSQVDAGGFSYNVPFFARLQGRLDVPALERALSDLVRRHESLRTTFGEEAGRPVQHILPDVAVTLRVAQVADEAEARREAEAEARRPFDLGTGPMLRARLLRVAEDDHVLLLMLHHISCDGWSLGVLERDLRELYAAHTEGRAPVLPALPIQYADHAVWQRDWLKGELLDEQLAWWTELLTGAAPSLELPLDRPRPPVQTFLGATVAVPLSPSLSQAVKALGRAESVTPFMLLLACFQVLMSRYSGQRDVVVGTPISGRNRRELENLIGFFVNTLAPRVDVDPEESFRSLLGRVRQVCLGAYARQDVPFETLVEALRPPRDLSRSPLFQVMFVIQGPRSLPSLPGLVEQEVSFDSGMSKFDLICFLRETPEGWVGFWEYNTALFDAATARRMAGHYVTLLEGLVADPSVRVGDAPLLAESERRQLLREWSGRETPDAVAGLMHAWVEAQVARSPDAVAVTDGVASLTYAELEQRANQLAHHLLALGVKPGSTVGLCLERGDLEMPVAVLATLKAGAAFLPLDPSYPAQRLAQMLEDTGAPVVLVQGELGRALPEHPGTRRVRLEDEAARIRTRPVHAPALSLSPETPCYFVYTSGSTGRPKGILMSHRAVGNMLRWLLARTVDPGATTLQFASLNFDVSFQELFGTWCLGGTVLLVGEAERKDPVALLGRMVAHGVGRLYLPFVALQALCEVAQHEAELPPLREVVTAGEQLQVTPALVSFFERLPGCVLENQYGPSEAHVVTAWRARGPPSTWPALPPVGTPISNVKVYVLDERGAPSPVGVVGEVYVGGASLAHGYWGRAELTAERFIPDALSEVPGARLYRTGDKARWLGDGNLEFLGRVDGQVKVRGFRVELGEVEVALKALPGVRDAVVVARQEEGGEKRLVGYVVHEAPCDVEVLRGRLEARLPEYLVPSVLVRLDTLPLAPTGKVDRKALPAPGSFQRVAREGHQEPRDALERALVGVWEEVLGVRPVGVTEDFFALGGHSLMAIRLLARIRGVVGRSLPVAALFQRATVEHVASVLRRESSSWTPLVRLTEGRGRRPFFCVHPVGGTVLSYTELAKHLGPEQPFHGLESRGLDGEAPPCESIPEMASLYLAAMRDVQPHGPYRLGGWSMGASIAWEMAHQLEGRGERVEVLALIDGFVRPYDGEGSAPGHDEAQRFGELFQLDLLRAMGHGEAAQSAETPEALLRILETHAREQGSGVTPSLSALRRVFEVNLLAAWRYVPKPYSGPVVSIEATGTRRVHGWEQVATGALTVHAIEGDHYSILRAPDVGQVASVLRGYLDEVEDSP